MKQWLVSISFFLVFIFTATAQQLIFKTYTVEDGLVANPVRRILQDQKGFIWIATWEGLSKYDGDKFTNYTIANGLSHNLVNDMYESPDGKLYVAENNGTVDILQQDAIMKKAAFRNVVINQFSVTQSNGVIAGTDTSGLYEIKNGTLVKPLQKFPEFSYNDIVNVNDSLLIGGTEGTLLILNRQFELVAEIKQPKSFLTYKIYKDSKNRVWLGTNEGLKLLASQQKKDHSLSFTLSDAPFNIPALRNDIITDIIEDTKGNLWVGTWHYLVKIEPDNNLPVGRQRWQQFSEEEGLPSNTITCIYQDKEKNIWIGTSLGLAKLVTKNDIRIYTMENGLASHAANFLVPVKNDEFLVSTDSSIQLYNTKNGVFSSIRSPHNFLYYGVVKNSWPVLFFGFNNKLGKYDPLNRRLVDYILPDSSNIPVYHSVIDANGIIFSGSFSGLVIRSGDKTWLENKFPYRISALAIDKKGYLWAGTWDNGLYRIQYTYNKNRTGRLTSLNGDQISLSIKNFSYLLPDKNIRSLFADSKSNIWVGTRYQGIVQLSDSNTNNKEQYTTQHFDLLRGIMSNFIRAIAEDAKGCIWIGSDLGIDKLIPSGNTFRVFNFSRINNYFAHVNAILPENGNSLWFTSTNGLVNIIDGEIEKTPAPPVYITLVNLGDTSFNYSTYHAGTKVLLKYYQNQVNFEFSSPAFINEKQILYSYRLLGSADTMWSKPASLHAVSYASLRPGNYHFQVRTTGWNGEWGAPANFIFSIRSPYWQTWWFYLLVGLFMILVFYAFYLYRIRQLLKMQKVRNRIATDLHDDIGSTLTNINMLSEISRKNLSQPREAEKFLSRISEEVAASSQALNDIIWNVNSRNDSMEETLSRMRRYAAELFDNSNTVCHLTMQETAAGKKLNMEQRRDVYLIYKETMNNILKHAAASNVWIDMLRQNGDLHLKIRDDGKGFGPSVISDRNGLKNIRSRTEKWKGTLTVITAPGRGTNIEITIPLEG